MPVLSPFQLISSFSRFPSPLTTSCVCVVVRAAYQAPAKLTTTLKDGFVAARHEPSVHCRFKPLVPQSERIAKAERATTAEQRFAKEHNLKLAGARKKRIQAADVLGLSSQQSTESSGSDFIPDKTPPAKSAAKFCTPFLASKRPTAGLTKESQKKRKYADKLGKKAKRLKDAEPTHDTNPGATEVCMSIPKGKPW